MKTFTLYVGSAPRSPSSPTVTLNHLQRLIAPIFHSFTVIEGEGIFRGQAEHTFLVKVTTFDVIAFLDEVEKIRRALDQEGIGIEHEGSYHRVVEGGDPGKLMVNLYPRIRPEYFQTVFQTEMPASGWPRQFAVITAWNPEGKEQSQSANEHYHSLLDSHCSSSGIPFWKIAGCSRDLQHCEPGLGVETTLSNALSIGRLFGQEAIYWVKDGHLLLINCHSGEEVPLGSWESRLQNPQKR